MFSAEVRVGRLLEVRLVSPVTLEDIDQCQKRLDELFDRHGEVVLVADYTRATVFSQEVAARLLDVFKRGKGRVARSAALVSQGAVFSLQVERLIAQAGNPIRRSFHEPFELKAFLGSALKHEEHIRLVQFLAEAQITSRA
jgi:hypothetical protein